MTEATRPSPLLPATDDHDTAGFFEAAARGVLAIRTCAQCGTPLHVPVAHCWSCGSWDTRWTETAGTGRLYSWTVVAHQVHPSYPVPYTIVLVELDDHPGVRLVGHLPGRPPLHAGLPMEASFETLPGGVALPQWRPVTQDTES